MPGLMRTHEGLRQVLEKLAYLPSAFLAPEERREISANIRSIFQNTLKELEKENLTATNLYACVGAMVASAEEDLDEPKFAKNLRLFLEALGKQGHSPAHEAVRPAAEKFFSRAEPFLASEEQSRKYRDAHSSAEIREHDKNILEKTMQIYALDYFLFAYENLKNSEDKKAVILSGAGKAPALAEDALADDMLKKVVYGLYGKELRRKMITDYYAYKKVFLPKPAGESLTGEKIKEISEALRDYCLSLLDASLEYGISELKNSLLEPWGGMKDLAELKKIIHG